MKEVVMFLRQLKANNNKEWFTEHKAEYQSVQAKFNAFCEELIHRIEEFDPSVRGLTLKDCTYRIYRDLRFSKDKSPYKTHMGVYVCRGGKKSGYSGYYFHVAAGNETDEIMNSHILAVGDYCFEPKVLKTIREDILNGDGDFDEIVRNHLDARLKFSEADKLKRVPQGFPADSPWAEYLKLKVFCPVFEPDDSFVFDKNLCANVAEIFKTGKPFLDYVNRAIDYVREEM